MEKTKPSQQCNPLLLIGSRFLTLYVAVGFLLRILLMLMSPADASFHVTDTMRLLTVGALSDLGMGILLLMPLLIMYAGLNEWKYNKATGWAITLLLAVALAYATFCHTIFDEYGGGAPRIAQAFLGWKLVSFGLRFMLPGIRRAWRRATLYATWGVYVFLFLCVTAGEVMFWQEFGVRYNFIAVDYLVYTHEVIGNIMESYSIVPLILATAALTAGIVALGSRNRRFRLSGICTPRQQAMHTATYMAMAAGSYLLLWWTHSMQSDNQYVTQLEQNGACDFVIAFQSNKLEYDKFYAMLPEASAKAIYRQETKLGQDGSRTTCDTTSTRRPNIVLITVESLSADFLARYGNTQRLTPCLDRLMPKSMVFDSLYAAGNRTVRGLEALSLCIPPSAGESIVKRKANHMGDLSVGSVLGRLGYRCQFLYGGDSYFDNMSDFFSHNGYEVIDRKDISPKDITFANIWGVCDEDIFRKSLATFDADASNGHPFFAQIMTTSNHRPYTYPTGRIKVDGKPNTRNAAVRYTDYAIGRFIDEASRKPWFANTVFIVIADHCASSAGKTSVPVDRYHIPCMVYAPSMVKPQVVNKVCSQIDIMPTVMAMLHLKSRVRFAGQDILAPAFRQRAFMATYQDLGYLEKGKLTLLSPVRAIRQYDVSRRADGTHEEIPAKHIDKQLVRKAQAYYQYTNLYQKAQQK